MVRVQDNSQATAVNGGGGVHQGNRRPCKSATLRKGSSLRWRRTFRSLWTVMANGRRNYDPRHFMANAK
jgi:hypothetical protein